MYLEKDENKNALKITLSLADLGKLATEGFAILEECGQDGIVAGQSTIVNYSRPRSLTGPNVYLDGANFAVILPQLFLPVEIRGVRDPDENYINTGSIPRDFRTIIDIDRTDHKA